MDDAPAHVCHFSEDPTIRRFVPHVPATNPTQPPSVWAIDAAHAPLYWFPRDVPRASVWADDADQRHVLHERFVTSADRICAAELSRLDEIRSAVIHRCTFDAADFRPWEEADGQYVSSDAVVPIAVHEIADLLGAHASAGVELRFVRRLQPLCGAIVASGLPFSLVRMRHAAR